jgi:hypothetical protein
MSYFLDDHLLIIARSRANVMAPGDKSQELIIGILRLTFPG